MARDTVNLQKGGKHEKQCLGTLLDPPRKTMKNTLEHRQNTKKTDLLFRQLFSNIHAAFRNTSPISGPSGRPFGWPPRRSTRRVQGLHGAMQQGELRSCPSGGTSGPAPAVSAFAARHLRAAQQPTQRAPAPAKSEVGATPTVLPRGQGCETLLPSVL